MSEHQVGDIDHDLMPPWATGIAEGYTQQSAQLCTRDGRRIGNAVVVSEETIRNRKFSVIVTDAGTVVRFTAAELEEAFYPPKWLTNLDTHLGFQQARGRGSLA